MSRFNWNFDQLKSHLSQRKEVKGWIVTEEHTHRRERYFLSDSGRLEIDQDRNVHARALSLRLFVHLDREGRQGEITKKLFPAIPLKDQIDMAIEAALQTDHQAWDLPSEVPSQIPDFKTSDPRMAEDLGRVMNELTQRIEASVEKKRKTQFNSAELFLSVHDRTLHLSNGLTHRSSQSRIYCEAAYSFSRPLPNGQVESDEYMSTQWAVTLDQLPIEKFFDETSERAERTLQVVKPATGKYPVIVDAEVLSTLLHGHLVQLTGSNRYHGLPFIQPGSEFIPEAHGDLLSITLDPTLEYGAQTAPLSEQGLLQSPFSVVHKNKVLNSIMDKQYGDYLNQGPTTVKGNLVIEPGQLSYSQLTQQSPQVIEILQFSGLFADPNSGTFSSEIRLARLFDNEKGSITYLKGGSLSGSIAENFQNLRLSNSRVFRSHFQSESGQSEGYFGPDYGLLSNVSIVG